MDEIVKFVVEFWEFLILGFSASAILGVSILIVAYFLHPNWWNLFGREKGAHAGRRWEQEFIDFLRDEKLRYVHWLMFVIIVAFVFFNGVIINSFSYHLLQPAHIYVVSQVESAYASPKQRIHREPVPDRRFYFSSLTWDRGEDDPETTRYYDSAKKLQRWQLADEQVNGHSYDDNRETVLRCARLIRGEILITMLMIIPWLLLCVWAVRTGWKKGGVRRIQLFEKRVARLVLMGGGLLFIFIAYFVLMTCFWSYEVEYHKKAILWSEVQGEGNTRAASLEME